MRYTIRETFAGIGWRDIPSEKWMDAVTPEQAVEIYHARYGDPVREARHHEGTPVDRLLGVVYEVSDHARLIVEVFSQGVYWVEPVYRNGVRNPQGAWSSRDEAERVARNMSQSALENPYCRVEVIERPNDNPGVTYKRDSKGRRYPDNGRVVSKFYPDAYVQARFGHLKPGNVVEERVT